AARQRSGTQSCTADRLPEEMAARDIRQRAIMNWINPLEYVVFGLVLTATVRPLGSYLAKVFAYEPTFMDRLVAPVERVIIRLVGPAAPRPMKWHEDFFLFFCFL